MKKVLKYIGMTFLVLVLLIGGLALQGFYRFDVNIFEVNRIIKSKSQRWGTPVQLIPEVFVEGESFENVEKYLNFSGYKNIQGDKVWKKYEDKTGPNKFVFTREANMLVCNIMLYVFLEFDQNNNLKSAIGTQHEHGCL